jgi:hypothetical protein
LRIADAALAARSQTHRRAGENAAAPCGTVGFMAHLKTIFDLRDHPDHGIVRLANRNLAAVRPQYLERFGAVASARWWDLYDRGLISRSLRVGKIVLVGASPDPSDDGVEIVQIETDREEIAYDREGFWTDPDVAVGRWVHIERVQVMAGNSRTIIDVRIWLDDATD